MYSVLILLLMKNKISSGSSKITHLPLGKNNKNTQDGSREISFQISHFNALMAMNLTPMECAQKK